MLIATLWKEGKVSGVCVAFFYDPPPCHVQRTIARSGRVTTRNSVDAHRRREANKFFLEKQRKKKETSKGTSRDGFFYKKCCKKSCSN